MINDSDSPREQLDIDRVIAMAEAEAQSEGATQQNYADRVEIGYKAFEIGLWELGRDNHAGARPWFQTAVDFGVDDACSLLAICVDVLVAKSTVPTTTDSAPQAGTPHNNVRDREAGFDHDVPQHLTGTASLTIEDLRREASSECTALAVFAVDFALRPLSERKAALAWVPRRQLTIIRSTAQHIIHAHDLVCALTNALQINLDLVLARTTHDHTLAHDHARKLTNALAQAYDRAFDLKRALDRDRENAGELTFARDRAAGIVRDLDRTRKLVRTHDVAREGVVDNDISQVLGPYRHDALVRDLAQVRDHAITRARDRALEHAFPADRVRDLALALARDRALEHAVSASQVHSQADPHHCAVNVDQAIMRRVEGSVATALDLAGALDRDLASALDPDHDRDMFNRELITAVRRLEEALKPPGRQH